MMKIAFFALILVCLAAASHIFQGTADQQFAQFKVVYGKQYKSEAEEQLRFRIFSSSLNVTKRMTEQSNGMTQYGVTQFSDLTPEEFAHLYLMKKQPAFEVIPGKDLEFDYSNVEIKSFWDWRFVPKKSGWPGSCVSAVYNQGQCGSCWAFSATEEIESMYCLQGYSGGVADHLSMQQIVSCDTTCYGCNGGWTYLAYEYVIGAGGIDSYSSYPYQCQTGTCAFNPANVMAKISSWSYVGQNNEAAMLSFLTSTGPISICVDAETWQTYQGGVVLGASCGTSVDHCVQITGYSANVQGYQVWIVRNSWGTSWGYSGYLYVQYGVNACCIASTPTTVQSN
jgi:C1A family cysteine protease